MTNIKTIRVLPLGEMFFIKKIFLEDVSYGGVVCYARKVSHDYKITYNEEQSKTHLYLEHQEEEYPRDELDYEILKQIQNKFPHAKSQTTLMMFDVDKEDNAQWLNQYSKETLQIIVDYVRPSVYVGNANRPQKAIEVLYSPVMDMRQKKMNANVHIVMSELQKYKHLQSLLENSYELFSKVCK